MQRHLLFAVVFGLTLPLATPICAAEPSELDGTWVEVVYRPSREEHPGYLPPRDPTTLVIDGHLFVLKTGGRKVSVNGNLIFSTGFEATRLVKRDGSDTISDPDNLAVVVNNWDPMSDE